MVVDNIPEVDNYFVCNHIRWRDDGAGGIGVLNNVFILGKKDLKETARMQ